MILTPAVMSPSFQSIELNSLELRWSVTTPKCLQNKASWIKVLENNKANEKHRGLEENTCRNRVGLKGGLRYKVGGVRQCHFSCYRLNVVDEYQRARQFSQQAFAFSCLFVCSTSHVQAGGESDLTQGKARVSPTAVLLQGSQSTADALLLN